MLKHPDDERIVNTTISVLPGKRRLSTLAQRVEVRALEMLAESGADRAQGICSTLVEADRVLLGGTDYVVAVRHS